MAEKPVDTWAEGWHVGNSWQGDFPSKNTREDGYAGLAPATTFPANALGVSRFSFLSFCVPSVLQLWQGVNVQFVCQGFRVLLTQQNNCSEDGAEAVIVFWVAGKGLLSRANVNGLSLVRSGWS